MLEKQIKEFLKKYNLKQSNIYNKLDISKQNFYKAIRTNEPYIAKHWGWYLDNNNLTKEQQYYMKMANKSGSWRINEEGQLIERHYD